MTPHRRRWSLPTACTLHELADNPAAAMPLDHEGRPLAAGLQVGLIAADTAAQTWPERIDPALVARVSALAGWSRKSGRAPLGWDDELKRPVTYQSGLLSALAGKSLSSRHAVIGSEYDLERDSDWRSRLLGATEDDEGSADVLLQCVEDIARNVFHHAGGGASGAHMAWRVTAKDAQRTWTFAVADTGKGIIRDVREALKRDLTDAEALDLAASPGFSGSKQPGQNRGVGLYVVRNVSLRLGGSLKIWTADHLYTSSSSSPAEARGQVQKVKNAWPGTVVEFKLKFEHQGRTSRKLIQEVVSELEYPGAGSGLPIAFYDGPSAPRAAADEREGRVHAVEIGRPSVVVAVERSHAADIGGDIAQLLATSPSAIVELNGASVPTISDAYAYALLYSAAPHLTSAGRIRVVAATAQVRAALMIAVRALQSEGRVPAKSP